MIEGLRASVVIGVICGKYSSPGSFELLANNKK
jgi:hypothetical protein